MPIPGKKKKKKIPANSVEIIEYSTYITNWNNKN